jgi:hypothetical protein
MKHGQDANLGAQMLEVRRDCHQGLGGCAKKVRSDPFGRALGHCDYHLGRHL